ncbi:MAG: hypothetical protein EOP00_32845 [Pedobacter sp.]|nr:MAG: hypothetical protein EOP00_32845 [Pedobacter sp.]
MALLLPIVIAVWKRQQTAYLKPIKVYIVLAFVLNSFAIAIDLYIKKKSDSIWLTNNNYVYNIHSIVRFICFCTFFEALQQPFAKKIKKILPIVSVVLALINFLFFEKFFHSRTISSTLFAGEAAILLFYCLQYFMYKLKEDTISKKAADFWVVMGLSLYVVFNFSFFLVYSSLSPENQVLWWHVHNGSYIIFCIFLARAFYVVESK